MLCKSCYFRSKIQKIEPLCSYVIAINLTGVSLFFDRGDFEIKDGRVSVSVFQMLYDACVRVLSVKLSKKHKRHQILWSKL